MSSAPEQPAYKPAGYCPKCGYRIDPGRCPECGREVKRPLRRHPKIRSRLRILAALGLLSALILAGPTLWSWCLAWAAATLSDSALVYLADGPGRQVKPLRDWAISAATARLPVIQRRETDRAEKRKLLIEEDLASPPGQDWEGTYSSVLGTLTLAPNVGYVLFDQYQNRLLCHGQVDQQDLDRLSFRESGNLQKLLIWSGSLGTAWGSQPGSALPLDQAVIVRAGDYRFLVPPDRMRAFCSDVNAGRSLHSYFVRSEPRGTRTDRMVVPAAYQKQLLPEAISVKITDVDPVQVFATAYAGGECRWIIKAEASHAEVLQPGMRVFPGEGSTIARAVVLESEGTRCTLEYIDWAWLRDNPDAPKIGDLLCTRERRPQPWLFDPNRPCDLPAPSELRTGDPQLSSEFFDRFERLHGETGKLKRE